MKIGVGGPEDLLKFLAGDSESEEDSEQRAMDLLSKLEAKRKNRYTTKDARLMLRNAYAVLKKTYHFKEGDIVRYKQGVESGRKEPCGGLGIFIRYENDPFPLVAEGRSELLPTTQVDCIIGVLIPTGAMAEFRSCSRYLEPAPEEED